MRTGLAVPSDATLKCLRPVDSAPGIANEIFTGSRDGTGGAFAVSLPNGPGPPWSFRRPRGAWQPDVSGPRPTLRRGLVRPLKKRARRKAPSSATGSVSGTRLWRRDPRLVPRLLVVRRGCRASWPGSLDEGGDVRVLVEREEVDSCGAT